MIVFVMFSWIVNSQNDVGQTLKGKVTDSQNRPIEDAYIYNKSTNRHAHSNMNGNFSLENNFLGDTIQIGIIGYKTYEFPLNESHLKEVTNIRLETKRVELEELIIGKEKDALLSIVMVDLKANPVNSSQEILRKVPGLFIGQHAGGGKAEQIFLRGFDVDHGTDVSINVDVMPVNMVSHAHGQGYSDLHFLIPETIQKIDFGKGPYYGDKGDFNTAGYVDFSTKTSLEKSKVSLEVGDFNSQRLLAMFNVFENAENSDGYIAFEHLRSDGFFESSQDFRRTNVFAKYTTKIKETDKLSLTASHFTSDWTASGQIPQREVDNGNITRFGAIDNTEGGNTSRSNLNVQHIKSLANNSTLKTNAFFSQYDFELYSNFTFFLDNPIDGDQIRQKENRSIYGLNSTYISTKNYENSKVKYTAGIGFRYDDVNDIELSNTKNRSEVLNRIQLGDVNQLNAYSFFNADFEFGDFEITTAARLDYFNFQYTDRLQGNEQLSESELIISPKLNLTYNFTDDFQLYAKTGIGFHSNDTRVVLQQNTNKFLPRAYGFDLGSIWKPTKNLIVNAALWYLLSEEELVYVGDAGIVEPSGESRRRGIDFGIRYQLTDWLYLDSDITWTHARSLEETSGNDYIPLAPDFTYSGGISMIDFHGFSGGIQMRYLDNRPANEDNSLVAKGYFVTDFNINYTVKNLEFGIAIENLFDVEWNETQFATTSQLQNELNPVTEIHFTPGTPLFVKARVAFSF